MRCRTLCAVVLAALLCAAAAALPSEPSDAAPLHLDATPTAAAQINCAVAVDHAHMATLLDRSYGNYQQMKLLLQQYFEALILPLARAGCEFISLTDASVRVAPPPPAATTFAEDGWADGSGVRTSADAMVLGRAAVAPSAAAIELERERRGAVWTRAFAAPDAAVGAGGARTAAPLPLAALVFVQDSVPRLKWHLLRFSVHLATHLHYARHHGYAVVLRIRTMPMPPGMPAYFTKVPAVYGALFGLRACYVLGVDWDSYVDPLAAVPLPALTADFPRAGIWLQFEENICAGVVIYRRSPATRRLLHEWWELGLTGAYQESFHDQSALKTLVLRHLANVTRLPMFGSPLMLRRDADYVFPKLSVFATAKTALRNGSDVGFVGMHAPHRRSQVALTSCMQHWKGCIPADAPALVRHHGHARPREAAQEGRLVEAALGWLALAQIAAVGGGSSDGRERVL
jgi:hypothetical protein